MPSRLNGRSIGTDAIFTVPIPFGTSRTAIARGWYGFKSSDTVGNDIGAAPRPPRPAARSIGPMASSAALISRAAAIGPANLSVARAACPYRSCRRTTISSESSAFLTATTATSPVVSLSETSEKVRPSGPACVSV